MAVEILGMRIFGRRSDKLPITERTKLAARELLSVADLNRGSRIDYMLGQIITAAFDTPESEDAGRASCQRIVTALKGWTISGWDR